MAIDDDIETAYNDVITKIAANTTKAAALRSIKQHILEIKLEEIPDPTIDEPRRTRMIIPNDTSKGTEIETTRRQQILTKVNADLAAL
jgi:hypothetical protein